MRFDKKPPLKPDKKVPPKTQKKGSIGYNKKSALLEDAITQMNAGKYGRASSALKDLLALDPLNAEARRLFATLHLRLGSLMSARTAFESLTREAMERQDYWLAESLLREYLTAGPRFVPFLEMLGHVYEEKGDVMAAVAEYGKAVEVLLEDPDAEKPNWPSELFARIRSLAPGSPVAFRFAAMFDTVTGQVLQPAPQAAVADVTSEPPAVAAVSESPAESPRLMSWEQMDPAPVDPAAAQVTSASAADPSTQAEEAIVPPTSPVEAASVVAPAEAPPDPMAVVQVVVPDALPEPQVSAEPVPPAAAVEEQPTEQRHQTRSPSKDETPAPMAEMVLPMPSVEAEPQPAIELQTETSAHPIAQTPTAPAAMPWDQVEEGPVTITPTSPSLESSVTEEPAALPPAHSSASIPEPVATVEPVVPAIEVLSQSGSHPIVEIPKPPAPMPWDQVEEAAILIPPPAKQTTPAAEDHVAAPVEDVGASVSTEAASPRLEVLLQTSSQPIAQAPTSPRPMPWDHVQEEISSVPAAAAPTSDSSIVQTALSNETAVVSPMPDPSATVEPAAQQTRSEVTSSGLTWEEILAAVAAMQVPAEPASPLSQAPVERAPEQALVEPAASVVEDSSDGVGAAPLSVDVPSAAPSGDSVVAASSLSAPMPWEQIEADQITIPSPEPEPAVESMTVEVIELEQEATRLVPIASDQSKPAATEETHEQKSAAAPSLDANADSAAELQILSPDAPVTSQDEVTPVPVEAHQAIAEPVPDVLPGSDPPLTSTVEQLAAPAFRLAESVTVTPMAAEVSHSESAQPVTEFTLAESQPVSREASLPEAVLPVEQPVEAMAVQEVVEPAPLETIPEAAVAPASPESVVEPAVPQEEETVVHEAVSVEPDIPAAAEVAPVLVQEPTLESEFHSVCEAQANESLAELPQCECVPAEPSQESPAVAEIQEAAVAPLEESAPISVASVDVPEPVAPAVVAEVSDEPVVVSAEEGPVSASPIPSEPVADENLKILWEDGSSAPAPAPAASGGNMLTRWFKKSMETGAVEAGAVPDVAPPAADSLVSDVPVVLQEEASVAPVEEQEIEPVAPVAPEIPVLVQEVPQRPVVSRPAGRPLWARAGEAVAALVGAGVSTTRSLVVMGLALVGFVLFLIGGTVAGVALTWLVLEEQPSAAYRNMTSVPQQMLQDSAKNGYVLLLGFGAPSTQDPVQVGMDRRVEGADQTFAQVCLTGEGASSSGDQTSSAEAVGKWIKASDPALQMSQNAGGVKSFVSQNEVGLGRYRQWLSKPFEDEGYGQSISPNCGLILQTHRLYVAEGFAQDVETGFARLETDVTAWRTVLGQAKTMPMKLLASAAMNDDIAVMGGLLQRPDLDERQIGRLAKLARPLEPAELSVRWPMQSQFVLATKTVDEAINRDRAETRPFYGAIAAALPLPKQRRFNAYAQYYEDAGKAAAEGRYADVPKQSTFVHAPPYGVGDLVLNPIESLVGVDPLPTWEAYAGRVLETDARLRLASLQAWLRRTPSEQDLLTRLAKAGQGLYDPFTGLPMLVNLKKGVLYSVGPDLNDNDAHERLDLVAKIPSVAWAGGKKAADQSAAK